jgi:hypothetical protein
VREHGHEYGADPGVPVLTGGSAGGHLVALAALTRTTPSTSPASRAAGHQRAGVRPYYGVYDLAVRDRHEAATSGPSGCWSAWCSRRRPGGVPRVRLRCHGYELTRRRSSSSRTQRHARPGGGGAAVRGAAARRVREPVVYSSFPARSTPSTSSRRSARRTSCRGRALRRALRRRHVPHPEGAASAVRGHLTHRTLLMSARSA